MKDDTRAWLAYAGENLAAAEILQGQGLYTIAELVRLLANHRISIT